MTKKLPTITICSSANFYRQAVNVQATLEAEGYTVLLPKSALKMKELNDFTVHKTWYGNETDYDKKADLMRTHFGKIAEGDITLVLNYEKHGKQNYIGPNVLMEMALSFYLKKPIFILNEMPEDSPFEEELKGMMPVLLHGKAEDIAKYI